MPSDFNDFFTSLMPAPLAVNGTVKTWTTKKKIEIVKNKELFFMI
ncbi:MAG: hypothetical protein QMC67_13890 [Candidatus Wallbacteria bacterium]